MLCFPDSYWGKSIFFGFQKRVNSPCFQLFVASLLYVLGALRETAQHTYHNQMYIFNICMTWRKYFRLSKVCVCFTCEISISQVHGFDRWCIRLLTIVCLQLISVNEPSDVTSGWQPAHLGTEAIQALHCGRRQYSLRYYSQREAKLVNMRDWREDYCGSRLRQR